MTENKVISLETKEKFRHKLADKEDHEFHASHFVTFTCPQCGAKDSLMKIDPSPEAQHVCGVEKEGEWKGELHMFPFNPPYFICSECEWVVDNVISDDEMIDWLKEHQEVSTVDAEKKERQEVQFTCPQCESEDLRAQVESCMMKVYHVYDDGKCETGGLELKAVSHFYCGGCGFILEKKDITTVPDLIKHYSKGGP